MAAAEAHSAEDSAAAADCNPLEEREEWAAVDSVAPTADLTAAAVGEVVGEAAMVALLAAGRQVALAAGEADEAAAQGKEAAVVLEEAVSPFQHPALA